MHGTPRSAGKRDGNHVVAWYLTGYAFADGHVQAQWELEGSSHLLLNPAIYRSIAIILARLGGTAKGEQKRGNQKDSEFQGGEYLFIMAR
jgi:hypothetical protein